MPGRFAIQHLPSWAPGAPQTLNDALSGRTLLGCTCRRQCAPSACLATMLGMERRKNWGNSKKRPTFSSASLAAALSWRTWISRGTAGSAAPKAVDGSSHGILQTHLPHPTNASQAGAEWTGSHLHKWRAQSCTVHTTCLPELAPDVGSRLVSLRILLKSTARHGAWRCASCLPAPHFLLRLLLLLLLKALLLLPGGKAFKPSFFLLLLLCQLSAAHSAARSG